MNTAALQKSSDRAARALTDRALERMNAIILGKDHAVRLALCGLLARGHLLIEDVPGVGKTTLAHVLATVLGLPFTRVQFTSDLLPADIIGVSVFDNENQQFTFHPGPIFSSVVLADEINRATPKTQSALLEAMEERQVSAEGETHPLPEPFFVIATQNPRHQIGTFPLPESQLDRFLMRLSLGFPDRQAERRLLKGRDRRSLLKTTAAAMDGRQLIGLQRRIEQVVLSDAILDYVQSLLDTTRSVSWLACGLSPRAGLALAHAARAWAFVHGRNLVLPEDIQAVAPSILGHRLVPGESAGQGDGAGLASRLLREVSIP